MTMKKIADRVLLPGTFACLFLLCGGCGLFQQENVPTRYYDLGIPEKPLSSARGGIIVQPFSSLSGERFRMVRRKGNLLRGDDDNKWQMPPGPLVTKYLTLTFRTDEKSFRPGRPDIYLDGRVTAFEADGDHAVLGLLYRVSVPTVKGTRGRIVWKQDRSILLREKMTGRNPEDFAAAMTRAMRKAAGIILKDADGK